MELVAEQDQFRCLLKPGPLKLGGAKGEEALFPTPTSTVRSPSAWVPSMGAQIL